MPQILVLLSPYAQTLLGRGRLEDLDAVMSDLVRDVFAVPKDDVAFSVMHLCHTRGEADVQVEVRYTAGEDEYGRGEIFDPPKEKREELCGRMLGLAKSLLALSCSVWIQPIQGSSFKMD